MPVDSMRGVETTLAAGMLSQSDAANSSRSDSASNWSTVVWVSEDSSDASVVAITATERGVDTIRKSTSMSEARESMNLGHMGRF